MASALQILQDGVVVALKADAAVSAIIGARAYTLRPQVPTFPYVTCTVSSFFPEEQDNFDRDILTLQVDAWACQRPQRLNVKPLADAVSRALHMADFSLADPYGLGAINLLSAEIPDDPIAGTNYAALRFECQVTRTEA